MKILLIHNYYGSAAPSGENTVFLAEKELLQSYGHEVIEYTTHSDSIRKLGIAGSIIGAAGVPWNFFHFTRVQNILKREKPDVMHVHNTFPLLSPAIFYASKNTKTTLFYCHIVSAMTQKKKPVRITYRLLFSS